MKDKTPADLELAEARENIDKAIKNLTRIAIIKVSGSDNFHPMLTSMIIDALFELLKMRERI